MMQHRKLFIAVLVIAFVLLVGLGVWIGTIVTGNQSSSGYTAVYLSTGDVYFGKFSSWPSPHLTNVWFLQAGSGSTGPSIAQFTKAVWGPTDEIDLNAKNIVFTARLASDSMVVKIMENPNAAQITPTGSGASTNTTNISSTTATSSNPPIMKGSSGSLPPGML